MNVANQDSNKPSSFIGLETERKVIKKGYRSKGREGVTQLLTYKKQRQLYFRDEQTFIPLQIIYFKRNKFNKYISTDIAQMCIVEQKKTTFDVTQKKTRQKDLKEMIGKSNGLTRHWTETNKNCTFQKQFFYRITNMVSEF